MHAEAYIHTNILALYANTCRCVCVYCICMYVCMYVYIYIYIHLSNLGVPYFSFQNLVALIHSIPVTVTSDDSIGDGSRSFPDS